MGIARPGRSRAPAPRARRPRRTRSGALRRSTTGRGRIRRGAAWAPPSSGTRDCSREKRLAGRRGSAAGSDAPSSPAISATLSPSARRRLIYKMAGMPTISLPASLGRLPRRRSKRANRGERPAPLPMRRKKRRERRNSYLANPWMVELSKAGCGGSSTRMGGKAPAVTIARAGKTPTALRNPPARRNKSARIRTFP